MKKLLLVLLILIGIPAFILAIPFILVALAIRKLSDNDKTLPEILDEENKNEARNML